ncbi:MAG: CHAT domain-containing protein, partial [Bacteroidota bacterium]
EQAFIFAEGNKASLLLDAARDNLARDNSGIQDSLLLQESRLKSKMAFYERKIAEARLMPEPGQEETLEGWERELFRLRTQFAELTKAMETSFPKYHQLKYTRGRVTVNDIRQSVLDDQSLLVEFFMGKERLYVFYLSEESLRWKVIEQPADLVAQISRLRDIVSSRPDSESFVENCQTYGRLAAVLYSELLADGVQMATGLSRLLIVPDDALNFLPFELLLTEAPEADVQDYRGSAMDYLFRRFRVSYNYSASLLVVNRQREFTERRESFLGMAPSFGSSIAAERACDREEQYNLRCNVPEVEHIHNILGGKMFRNVEANKEAFIRESGDYRVIHLATHACLDENDAMLSKIFFSDGDLSIYELSKMDLQADLIVLSACNTNTGILLKGEGVASVARGFSLAGCASSLTSLWSVDDCATSEMMQFYYDELGEGRSKDEAIQRAKLSYLAQADKASSHPYFWSAFVQLGDTKPLEAGRTWWQFLLYFLPFTALPILALLLLKMVFNRKSATVS